MALADEIKQIWANKYHHSDGGDPYKIAKRIAIISYEIGVTPCWNCKGGKDRTGWMDTEIKHLLSSRGLKPDAAHGRKLDKGSQSLLRVVALNSGNQEIQRYNTGAPGNKCFGMLNIFTRFFANLSLRQRLGDAYTTNRIKGFSDLV